MTKTKSDSFPDKMILWNPIALFPYFMKYERPLTFEIVAKDTGPRNKLFVLTKEVSCNPASDAAFLKSIRVRLKGEKKAVSDLAKATLSLHIDGENAFMDDLKALISEEFVLVKPMVSGVSCLFEAKAFKEGEKNYQNEPAIGFFLPNGSNIQARVDEFKSPEGLGAEIEIELILGIYSRYKP